jgi:hypothetical protein
MRIKRFDEMVSESAKIIEMPELNMEKVAKVSKWWSSTSDEEDDSKAKYCISLFNDIKGVYRYEFDTIQDLLSFAKLHNLLK